MFTKSYFVSEGIGLEMERLYPQYIRRLDLNIKNLRSDLLFKYLDALESYDPSKHGLLVRLAKGFLYTHIQYGYTKHSIACQLEHSMYLFEVGAIDDLSDKFKSESYSIRNNSSLYFEASLSDDKQSLVVKGGDDIWLDLSKRTHIQLNVADFIIYLYSGTLKVSYPTVEVTDEEAFCVIVNTVDLPNYITVTSGDFYIDACASEYLSMFDGEQYLCDNDTLLQFIKYNCSCFVREYRKYIAQQRNLFLCNNNVAVEYLRTLVQCPFLASALLQTCGTSGYTSLEPLAALQDAFSYVDSEEVSHEFSLDLSAFVGSSINSSITLYDLATEVLQHAHTYTDWEMKFLQWIENSIYNFDCNTEGAIYRLANMMHGDKEANPAILWTIVKLLYSKDGTNIIQPWNWEKVSTAVALWLKFEYPDGTLCFVDNEDIAYRDRNNHLYPVLSRKGTQSVVPCELPKDALYEAVEHLHGTYVLEEPCGLLEVLDTILQV